MKHKKKAALTAEQRLLTALDNAISTLLDQYEGHAEATLESQNDLLWNLIGVACKVRGQKPPAALPDSWPIGES
jgi:hypothetical protein